MTYNKLKLNQVKLYYNRWSLMRTLKVFYNIMKGSKTQKPKLSLKLQTSQDSSFTFEQFNYSKTKIKFSKHQPLQDTVLRQQVQPRDISFHIQTLKQILKFRNLSEAPVDLMGCGKLYDNNSEDIVRMFQILVSIMLSVQTTDQITSSVVRSMIKEGCLKPHLISEMEQEELQAKIKRTNYHKTKARNIIKAAKHFIQHGVPKTYEQVIKLSGVGIKVGTLYMKQAIGVNQGIGVDTHVHRITNRLGWIQTNKPEDTELRLRQKFPKQFWMDMNLALVGFGQTICEAKKPKCHQCPVESRCPSSILK